MSETPLLRPKPVRPFDLTTSPTISSSSRPDSPTQDPIASADTDAHPAPPSRTRSILNLTSSTLFGIYSGNGYGEEGATPWSTGTPWGTGAQTPNEGSRRNTATDSRFDFDDALNKNRQRRSSMVQSSAPKTASKSLVKKRQAVSRNDWAPFLGKNIALGVVGVCYGILISHLHDKEQITPVKVKGIPHHSIGYLAGWGIVAVAFGQLMPWVDRYWASEDDDEDVAVSEKYGANGKVGHKRSSSFVNDNGRAENRGMWTPEWYDVVRSIGAFVGIAFAIRKLPWQSTLQLSLTLALSNPAIWYLLDRTPPGFVLSTTVALSGTAVLLSINPDIIPSPGVSVSAGAGRNATSFRNPVLDQGNLVGGLFSQESVGVATWIASVLFVSCVCFGNIGRRL